MKLHPDVYSSTLNTVTAYGAGYVDINQTRFEKSILLLPTGPVILWPVDHFEALNQAHFEAVAAYQPEMLILGSGATLRFPNMALYASLSRLRIGIEVMDSQAACRTYNVLIAEGRQVAAAILIEK